MTQSRDRGVVAVEFALVIPILLLLVLGIIEGGMRYYRETQVNNAALIAARTMSISPHDAVKAQSDAHNAGIPLSVVVTFDQNATTCKTGVNVKAFITFTEDSPTKAFGQTVTYKGEAVARCDG